MLLHSERYKRFAVPVAVVIILLTMYVGARLMATPITSAYTYARGYPKLPDFNPDDPRLIIHQTWKSEKLPQRFQKWSETWKKCFPKAKHILWTDDSNRRFIAKHYPWFLPRFDTLPSQICRADAVRYLYMFHFGGLYTDLDNECLRPFPHLLSNTTIMFGAMKPVESKTGRDGYVKEGYVPNSIMYSKPRHPFWMSLIHRIMDTPNNVPVGPLAAAEALMVAVNGYRQRMESNAGITVYPPLLLDPISRQTAACKNANLMTNEEMDKCRKTFLKTSYVIQYHTHNWKDHIPSNPKQN